MSDEKIFQTLGELQNAYRDYHSSEPSGQFDLRSFAVWLYNREAGRQFLPREYSTEGEWKGPFDHVGVDDQITFFFLGLNKLIKFYVKKGLEGTELVGVDDLHFLMRLSGIESMTKSEIINTHISEMSSGTEVIKRLLKRGLIEDFADPDDKRSKRVRITQKGMKIATGIGTKLHNLHRLFLGMISQEEKFSLLAVITKIHSFHFNIFNNEKNASLEELFEKYLGEPAHQIHQPGHGDVG
jgi:MarR family transcriptional regulator, lower aerobic nicotinate degradation pathway regulator